MVNFSNSKLPILKPIDGKIVSAFNEKNFGIKIKPKESSNVIASGEGIVVFTETVSKTKTVIIAHSSGYFSLYANCSEVLCKKNDKVKLAETIAKIDLKRKEVENYLYFEVWKNQTFFNPESLFVGR
ncbi:M23 family metallopeptidase [bacterium]|nr:M23 family metallopeptidase [bacterium]